MALDKPFPTEQQVYDRLRWDTGFHAPWMEWIIVYETRAGTFEEVPFHAFDPNVIPMHRVREFRCGGIVLWARIQRIDKISNIRWPVPIQRIDQQKRRFRDEQELLDHLQKSQLAWVLVRLDPRYPSFVYEIMFYLSSQRLRMRVEWMSYGLDWLGDSSCVFIAYEFDHPSDAIRHVGQRHGVGVTSMSPQAFPLPVGTPLQDYPRVFAPLFQNAWTKLQGDMKAGVLDEPGLHVVQRFEGFR